MSDLEGGIPYSLGEFKLASVGVADPYIRDLMEWAIATIEAPAVERSGADIEAGIIRWLRGAGHAEAANALAELHAINRALLGLEPLVFWESPDTKSR